MDNEGGTDMVMTKEELAEIRGWVEEKATTTLTTKDKCGDCEFKDTCLIRNENKIS